MPYSLLCCLSEQITTIPSYKTVTLKIAFWSCLCGSLIWYSYNRVPQQWHVEWGSSAPFLINALPPVLFTHLASLEIVSNINIFITQFGDKYVIRNWITYNNQEICITGLRFGNAKIWKLVQISSYLRMGVNGTYPSRKWAARRCWDGCCSTVDNLLLLMLFSWLLMDARRMRKNSFIFVITNVECWAVRLFVLYLFHCLKSEKAWPYLEVLKIWNMILLFIYFGFVSVPNTISLAE